MDYEVVTVGDKEKHIMWQINTTDFLCFPADKENPEYQRLVKIYGIPVGCPELASEIVEE
jgi:hypothetical protein